MSFPVYLTSVCFNLPSLFIKKWAYNQKLFDGLWAAKIFFSGFVMPPFVFIPWWLCSYTLTSLHQKMYLKHLSSLIHYFCFRERLRVNSKDLVPAASARRPGTLVESNNTFVGPEAHLQWLKHELYTNFYPWKYDS